ANMLQSKFPHVLSAILLAWTSAAIAQKGVDIDLVEPVDWTVAATTIQIEAAAVNNNRPGGTSGTLRLQVWATDTAYAGGVIDGFVMGSAVLGELDGGDSF